MRGRRRNERKKEEAEERRVRLIKVFVISGKPTKTETENEGRKRGKKKNKKKKRKARHKRKWPLSSRGPLRSGALSALNLEFTAAVY